MVKSTGFKSGTLSTNTKSTTTPTKGTSTKTTSTSTVSTKAMPTKAMPTKTTPTQTAPTKNPVPKPVVTSPDTTRGKPVKEVANAIDKEVIKEREEATKTQNVKGSQSASAMAEARVGGNTSKDVLFVWKPHGARDVKLTGSFNDWKKRLDMTPTEDRHECEVSLEPGKYAYKFIVDGEWCYDFTAPNEDDGCGNVNNVITV